MDAYAIILKIYISNMLQMMPAMKYVSMTSKPYVNEENVRNKLVTMSVRYGNDKIEPNVSQPSQHVSTYPKMFQSVLT
jgi:hypothetical protein